jgi:hypothetical protein
VAGLAQIPTDSPGPVALSIGAVTFNSSECPEELPIGGVEQLVVVHQLPGGTRVVSAFGPNAKPVSWSGKLFAGNVQPRIRQLRIYAVSGQQLTLVWGNEAYLVVVRDFEPVYLGGYAKYTITVEVVADQNGAFTLSSPTTIDSQIHGLQAQADAANASVIAADPAGATVFQPQYSAVKASVQAANPIAQNINFAATTIVPAVTAAVAAVTTYSKGLPQTSTLFAAAMQLTAALTAIGQNVTRGQSASAVQVQGQSLFSLAALHYGDITQAFALAQANGLPSPFLSSAQQTYISLAPFLGQ